GNILRKTSDKRKLSQPQPAPEAQADALKAEFTRLDTELIRLLQQQAAQGLAPQAGDIDARIASIRSRMAEIQQQLAALKGEPAQQAAAQPPLDSQIAKLRRRVEANRAERETLVAQKSGSGSKKTSSRLGKLTVPQSEKAKSDDEGERGREESDKDGLKYAKKILESLKVKWEYFISSVDRTRKSPATLEFKVFLEVDPTDKVLGGRSIGLKEVYPQSPDGSRPRFPGPGAVRLVIEVYVKKGVTGIEVLEYILNCESIWTINKIQNKDEIREKIEEACSELKSRENRRILVWWAYRKALLEQYGLRGIFALLRSDLEIILAFIRAHGLIRAGPALVRAKGIIATPETLTDNPLLEKVSSPYKEAILAHERAHLAGKGESQAYIAEASKIRDTQSTNRQGVPLGDTPSFSWLGVPRNVLAVGVMVLAVIIKGLISGEFSPEEFELLPFVMLMGDNGGEVKKKKTPRKKKAAPKKKAAGKKKQVPGRDAQIKELGAEYARLESELEGLLALKAKQQGQQQPAASAKPALAQEEILEKVSSWESKINDSNPRVRLAAILILGSVYIESVRQGKTIELASLESRLKDSDSGVRRTIVEVLGSLYAELVRQGKTVEFISLESKFGDLGFDVRYTVVKALGYVYAELVRQGKMELASLESKLNDSDRSIRQVAALALGPLYAELVRQGKTVELASLESKLNDSDWSLRNAAAEALGPLYAESVRQGKTVELTSLESKLNDSDPGVRTIASLVLGPLYAELVRQGKMELASLESKLNDSNLDVHRAATEALGSLYTESVRQGKTIELASLESKLNDSDLMNINTTNAAAEALGSVYVELARQGKMELASLESKFKNYKIAFYSVRALGQLYAELVKQGKMELSSLESKLNNGDWYVIWAVASGLGLVYAELIRQSGIKNVTTQAAPAPQPESQEVPAPQNSLENAKQILESIQEKITLSDDPVLLRLKIKFTVFIADKQNPWLKGKKIRVVLPPLPPKTTRPLVKALQLGSYIGIDVYIDENVSGKELFKLLLADAQFKKFCRGKRLSGLRSRISSYEKAMRSAKEILESISERRINEGFNDVYKFKVKLDLDPDDRRLRGKRIQGSWGNSVSAGNDEIRTYSIYVAKGASEAELLEFVLNTGDIWRTFRDRNGGIKKKVRGALRKLRPATSTQPPPQKNALPPAVKVSATERLIRRALELVRQRQTALFQGKDLGLPPVLSIVLWEGRTETGNGIASLLAFRAEEYLNNALPRFKLLRMTNYEIDSARGNRFLLGIGLTGQDLSNDTFKEVIFQELEGYLRQQLYNEQASADNFVAKISADLWAIEMALYDLLRQRKLAGSFVFPGSSILTNDSIYGAVSELARQAQIYFKGVEFKVSMSSLFKGPVFNFKISGKELDNNAFRVQFEEELEAWLLRRKLLRLREEGRPTPLTGAEITEIGGLIAQIQNPDPKGTDKTKIVAPVIRALEPAVCKIMTLLVRAQALSAAGKIRVDSGLIYSLKEAEFDLGLPVSAEDKEIIYYSLIDGKRRVVTAKAVSDWKYVSWNEISPPAQAQPPQKEQPTPAPSDNKRPQPAKPEVSEKEEEKFSARLEAINGALELVRKKTFKRIKLLSGLNEVNEVRVILLYAYTKSNLPAASRERSVYNQAYALAKRVVRYLEGGFPSVKFYVIGDAMWKKGVGIALDGELPRWWLRALNRRLLEERDKLTAARRSKGPEAKDELIAELLASAPKAIKILCGSAGVRSQNAWQRGLAKKLLATRYYCSLIMSEELVKEIRDDLGIDLTNAAAKPINALAYAELIDIDPRRLSMILSILRGEDGLKSLETANLFNAACAISRLNAWEEEDLAELRGPNGLKSDDPRRRIKVALALSNCLDKLDPGARQEILGLLRGQLVDNRVEGEVVIGKILLACGLVNFWQQLDRAEQKIVAEKIGDNLPYKADMIAFIEIDNEKWAMFACCVALAKLAEITRAAGQERAAAQQTRRGNIRANVARKLLKRLRARGITRSRMILKYDDLYDEDTKEFLAICFTLCRQAADFLNGRFEGYKFKGPSFGFQADPEAFPEIRYYGKTPLSETGKQEVFKALEGWLEGIAGPENNPGSNSAAQQPASAGVMKRAGKRRILGWLPYRKALHEQHGLSGIYVLVRSDLNIILAFIRKHGLIRAGPALLRARGIIATPQTIKNNPLLDKVSSPYKEAILTHEQAHLAGKGESQAYIAEASKIRDTQSTNRQGVPYYRLLGDTPSFSWLGVPRNVLALGVMVLAVVIKGLISGEFSPQEFELLPFVMLMGDNGGEVKKKKTPRQEAIERMLKLVREKAKRRNPPGKTFSGTNRFGILLWRGEIYTDSKDDSLNKDRREKAIYEASETLAGRIEDLLRKKFPSRDSDGVYETLEFVSNVIEVSPEKIESISITGGRFTRANLPARFKEIKTWLKGQLAKYETSEQLSAGQSAPSRKRRAKSKKGSAKKKAAGKKKQVPDVADRITQLDREYTKLQEELKRLLELQGQQKPAALKTDPSQPQPAPEAQAALSAENII
ncbi:sister chromatid cohesion protein PDS5, partial [Candidatus Omnitrophota bacterium]